MKMTKTLKLYSIQIFFVVLVVLGFLIFTGKKTGGNNGFVCNELRDGWKVVQEDGSYSSYEKLPEYVKVDGTSTVTIQREIAEITPENDTIGFFSFQQQMFVYLDDEEILRFAPEEGSKSKTPGNGWKFVKLNPEDEGKTFSIRIVQCYQKNKVIYNR